MADFLHRVKEGIDKGVTVVTVKSKEMVGVKRARNQIGLLEDQKDNALCELGETVYQMYHQNSFNEEKIRAKCELIALVSSQIHEKEAYLKKLHLKANEALGKSFCIFCESELSACAAFCSKCGKKVEKLY